MRVADGLHAGGERTRAKPPPPFSLRLSEAERARLKAEAGNQPLGSYIRSRLLGDNAETRRRSRRPRIDEQTAARLLAALGKSRLANNLNQLARAANSGSLPLTPETEAALEQACADIRAIRLELMRALGLQSKAER